MFTFQENSYELIFGAPTTPQHRIQDDLIMDDTYMNTTLISFGDSGNGWAVGEARSLEPSLSLERKIESKNGCSEKKVVHREVEKKRRQEMTALYASLGSLLPRKQIKGKRSVCDQIEGAVDHIKQTEKNIERLRIRRDKLKKSLGLSNPKFTTSSCADNDCITVNLAADGLEILINSSGLGLSRLLPVLAQRNLDVVSYVSTRKEGKTLQIIKIEAADMTSLDASELQDRLRSAIK